MSEYEPGTVALIRVSSDYPPEIGIHGSHGKWYVAGPRLGSQHGWYEDHIEILRPLVVIDPEDAEQVKRLADAFTDRHHSSQQPRIASEHAIRSLADALREFANPTPPRPTEPKHIGALVTDKDGDTWARHAGGLWTCLNLSPGVGEPSKWDYLCDTYGPLEVVR